MYLSLKRADGESVFAIAAIIGPHRAMAIGLPEPLGASGARLTAEYLNIFYRFNWMNR
jgi:hypothetical protein